MLTHPTIEKLHALHLTGMARALEAQRHVPDMDTLSFEEYLGLLLDAESTERDNRRLQTRLRTAALRSTACLEDIDYRHHRGLDKSLMKKLATCQWLHERLNVLITGPSGIGKSWLACALAHQACRQGFTARYLRLPRLLPELAIARGDGRYRKLLAQLARLDVILLDDFGLAALTEEQRRDLLEILEDRYERRSTVVTSQYSVEHWHDLIGDPTLADAILDRLVHNAYRLRIEFTKSRPRHSNDNGLAETKNGAVVRKCFGYSHIPQRFATEINAFCAGYLNPYLNFHRPCLFAEDTLDAKGKIKKTYPQRLVMTPLEKLASLPHADAFLKPGITLARLQAEATRLTDNEAAQQLHHARSRLFQSIHNRSKRAA